MRSFFYESSMEEAIEGAIAGGFAGRIPTALHVFSPFKGSSLRSQLIRNPGRIHAVPTSISAADTRASRCAARKRTRQRRGPVNFNVRGALPGGFLRTWLTNKSSASRPHSSRVDPAMIGPDPTRGQPTQICSSSKAAGC